MQRTKDPAEKIREKLEYIIESLSNNWLPEERETSILFDYEERAVYLETSYPTTARRWFENMWGDPKVDWTTNANTLKIKVPWDYCRQADLIIKKKYREYSG